MPNIKPISDLRNYASLLDTVEVGKPLYLTKWSWLLYRFEY